MFCFIALTKSVALYY